MNSKKVQGLLSYRNHSFISLSANTHLTKIFFLISHCISWFQLFSSDLHSLDASEKCSWLREAVKLMDAFNTFMQTHVYKQLL